MIKRLLKYQDWHLVLLAFLVSLVLTATNRMPHLFAGETLGLSTKTWLWTGVAAAILHQVYITVVWRIQQETGWLTSNLPRLGYAAYLADYTILLAARLAAAVLTSIANRGCMDLPGITGLAAPVLIVIVLLAYMLPGPASGYFNELAGTQHFTANMRNTFPPGQDRKTGRDRKKYYDAGPYILLPLVFYIPGLFYASPAGLILALFNHLYTLIHYFCTVHPDSHEP